MGENVWENLKFFVATGWTVLGKICEYPLTNHGEWYIIDACFCGYSLMVKLQLPKLAMRVRFPLLAPKKRGCQFDTLSFLERMMGARNRFKLPVKLPLTLGSRNLLLGFAERGSDSRYLLLWSE